MNIKFRAWDKNRNLMIDEIVVIDLYHEYIGYLYQSKINHGEAVIRLPINDVALMQSTGLKDKNGLDIFEGDVLYHPLQGKRVVFYPYSDRVASFGLREVNTGFGSTLQNAHAVWQVIGNIHENPKLLEVSDDSEV